MGLRDGHLHETRGAGDLKPFAVGFVFARGGSKGVPRKNIRLLNGKPLIAYSIEAGLKSHLVDRVVVSTNDAEIADIARDYGAEVPFMRPAELAQDDTPEPLAWQHALRTLSDSGEWPKIDVFVSIPATSPLRAVGDIDACIRELLKGDSDLVITVKPSERSPYFNMVALDDNGYARLVIPPIQEMHHRQSAPSVYDMATVTYVARPEYVLSSTKLFDGKVKAVVVPRDRGMDIDTELDLKFAEFLLSEEGKTASDGGDRYEKG